MAVAIATRQGRPRSGRLRRSSLAGCESAACARYEGIERRRLVAASPRSRTLRRAATRRACRGIDGARAMGGSAGLGPLARRRIHGMWPRRPCTARRASASTRWRLHRRCAAAAAVGYWRERWPATRGTGALRRRRRPRPRRWPVAVRGMGCAPVARRAGAVAVRRRRCRGDARTRPAHRRRSAAMRARKNATTAADAARRSAPQRRSRAALPPASGRRTRVRTACTQRRRRRTGMAIRPRLRRTSPTVCQRSQLSRHSWSWSRRLRAKRAASPREFAVEQRAERFAIGGGMGVGMVVWCHREARSRFGSVSSKGRSSCSMASRARKIRERTVPIGHCIRSAISS